MAAGLLVLALIYNGHINRRNAVDYAYASIDVQLKKRWDLVPNLVSSVKAFARHERDLFADIIQARHAAVSSHDASAQRFAHEAQLDTQLPRLVAVAESYPELKSDKAFLNLQRNLTEIEAQIAAARRAYNASVMDYNNGVDMFPSSLVAGLFGFQRREHFITAPAERSAQSIHV
ncbi:LemA family protein [Verrucomicrobiaceae bacterium R5-34]|uniref:LemA family protein n=1 Tax=Oceaniferula flava TaxID=2800421 RepID=A0AAE2V9V4_9BACT|nr:LemA family protein [Oceaniferula flavus]MBK1830932.1 LemA family protein [Verrucomicrobiaceae bacterium R5-34]MBK1855778.1 LemA family protein [Oceaniferula flavus]MBM1137085.1 LemA family protein [Oceaniferula flavus]